MIALSAFGASFASGAAEMAVMREAKVNGVTIAYEDHGKGEPLLLLHGYGSCAKAWSELLPAFLPGHRIIVAELCDHGRSGEFEGPFKSSDAASDIIALLDHLKLERVKAIGISMGGITLLHAATRRPELIEALVLVGTGQYLPVGVRELRSAELPPPVLDEYRACVTRGKPQLDAVLSRFDGLGQSFDDINFTPPLLSTIKARTLIVHGDSDFFFPVEMAVEMHRAIANSQLWIVPGGSHVPIFDNQRLEFEKAALRVLSDPPQAP